jgi:hypothetical protein
MPVAKALHAMSLDKVTLVRDERQRKKIENVAELAASIERIGLLNPIVIRRDTFKLIAGERRLTAYRYLRDRWAGEGENPWASIPYRYFDTLDETEAQIVELEENLRRDQLTWQETVLAAFTIHQLFEARNPDQTLSQTAEHVGIESSTLSKYLQIARELRAGNTLVADSSNMTEAYNKVKRGLDRAAGEAVNTLLSGTLNMAGQMDQALAASIPQQPKAEGTGPVAPVPQAKPVLGTVLPARSISVPGIAADGTATSVVVQPPEAAPAVVVPFLNADFNDWASRYTGEPFNLLHCDFPYGINHQKSKQGRVDEYGAYDDSEDVYWMLLETLARHKTKLLYPSSHIIFWFSMNHYSATVAFFEKYLSEFTFEPFPLVWWKDRSIAPDVDRRPRRVYETALFGFSGDRRVVNTRGNLVQCGCGQKSHASEKPAEMLRTFFRMVVDKHTKMLDPTCGSGSAVRAAKSLGAQTVLGLERDSAFFANAVQQYQMAEMLGFNIADKGGDE